MVRAVNCRQEIDWGGITNNHRLNITRDAEAKFLTIRSDVVKSLTGRLADLSMTNAPYIRLHHNHLD